MLLFSLANSPFIFYTLKNRVSHYIIDKYVLVYLVYDDILVYSESAT